MKTLILFLMFSLFSLSCLQAQTSTPARLDSLMTLYSTVNKGTMLGYRIQMYYGNNQIQSKAEADVIKAEFLDAFPKEGAYLEYEAPFWRLCVGDYRNYRDAKKASKSIATQLPQYGGNLIVIANQKINLPTL